MEPEIRYVRSADGVNIATHRLGEDAPGLPVVVAGPYSMGVFSIDWGIPDFCAGLTGLARDRPVISYDARGFGLSDHNVTDFGLDARVADLAAVVDSVGPRVSVLSRGPGSLQALAYAARHPDRVARLVMSTGFARGRDFRLNRDRLALAALIDTNYELYLQAITLADFGWDDGKVIARDLLRHVPRESLKAAFSATRDIDVSDELRDVRCPVLVINGLWQGSKFSATVRRLAAMLPDARLAEVDYASPLIFHHRVEEHLAVVAPFLAESDAPASVAPTLASGTAIILFADIVDSTALTERIGDAAFRERARALDVSLRDIIAGAGGTTIDAKTLGDGVLATFPAASQAIDAAMRCAASGEALGLPLHVGLHAGDVIREEGNVFGGAVNIAARDQRALGAGRGAGVAHGRRPRADERWRGVRGSGRARAQGHRGCGAGLRRCGLGRPV